MLDLMPVRDLMADGNVDAARNELTNAYGSEPLTDFAIAGLGSEFDAFTDALQRLRSSEYEAAGHLGMQVYQVHVDSGDELSAQIALQLLIDHGPPEVATKAAVSRAAHFVRFGDHERAEQLYLWAMENGDATALAVSGYNLAETRAERDDTDGAIAVHRRVVDSGGGVAVPGSCLRLGELLAERGDHEAARAAFRRGTEFDTPDGAEASIALMSSLLGDQSEPEVRAALAVAEQTIADSPRPEAVAYAHTLIGMAAKEAGDTVTAEQRLRLAIEMEQPISEFATEALDDLRGLRE